MNSGSHPCYSQSLNSLMSSEAELCSGGRAAALQRMAVKKYLSSSHQQQQHQQQSALHNHHSHTNHIRNHQYVHNQTRNYLSSLLNSDKNYWPTGNSCIMSINPLAPNTPEQQISLDQAARFHHNAAC